jgi:hypothetical protein
MIRATFVFVLFLFGAFFVGLYAAYGEFDPCRALAVESARRSSLPAPVAKTWSALTGERKNPVSCTRSLLSSWHARWTS